MEETNRSTAGRELHGRISDWQRIRKENAATAQIHNKIQNHNTDSSALEKAKTNTDRPVVLTGDLDGGGDPVDFAGQHRVGVQDLHLHPQSDVVPLGAQRGLQAGGQTTAVRTRDLPGRVSRLQSTSLT